MLDGRTGKRRWFRPFWERLRMGADNLPGLLAGPDLDGDGTGDLVTVARDPGELPKTHSPGYPLEREWIFAEAISGRDGHVIWWWNEDVTNYTTPQIGPPLWWGRGPDGWPMLVVPLGGKAPGEKEPSWRGAGEMPPVVRILEASTGRVLHTIEGLSWPRLADLDGDGLEDLWGAVAGKLGAFRAGPPEAWRSLDKLVAAGDLDGDGIVDAMTARLHTPAAWEKLGVDSRTALARSGRDGRVLWSLTPGDMEDSLAGRTRSDPRSGLTTTLATFPLPGGNLDGDGRDELLVQGDDQLSACRGDRAAFWSRPNRERVAQVLPGRPGQPATVILESMLALDGATGDILGKGRPARAIDSASLAKSPRVFTTDGDDLHPGPAQRARGRSRAGRRNARAARPVPKRPAMGATAPLVAGSGRAPHTPVLRTGAGGTGARQRRRTAVDPETRHSPPRLEHPDAPGLAGRRRHSDNGIPDVRLGNPVAGRRPHRTSHRALRLGHAGRNADRGPEMRIPLPESSTAVQRPSKTVRTLSPCFGSIVLSTIVKVLRGGIGPHCDTVLPGPHFGAGTKAQNPTRAASCEHHARFRPPTGSCRMPNANETGVLSRFLGIFTAILTMVLAGTLAQGAPDDGEPALATQGYEKVARPFIEQNCLACHGAKKAKAGYRIDLLGIDFAAANVAEHWKEVIDRIDAGEMPPEGNPRPDPKQAAAFVAWVNEQLRRVEMAAKNAGGRIPMRRLNRDEYANTVRDLLKLDEKIVRPLIEELPGDGQAEGFDRLGLALFFDQTQIERSLAVAEKVAAVAIVTDPPKVNRRFSRFDDLRRRPPPAMVEVYPSFTHRIPRGAEDRIIRPDVVEYLQGYPTYRKEYDGWGVIDHFSISQVVTQDGYYRFRIRAKVDNRGRTEPNKFRLQYGLDSPIQVETEVLLDPSGTTEVLMFLRGPVGGEVKGPQVFNLLWNHTEKAVIKEPNYIKLFFQKTGLAGKMERAAASRAPQAEMEALRKELDDVISRLNSWEGPANIYNPEMDVETLPRLLIESIEVEGPIQPEWPPPSHRALFFAGDERRDDAYIREMIARFLPRAYRRPVTEPELDAIVAVVNDARTTGKRSFPDAMRTGLQRVLCAPGFLFLEEPTGSHPERRPLSDYERASRLSYFLWSTMPDDELFALAAAGKLREPAVAAAQVERMLADPKSDQLVRNFGGQWLSVRAYGSTQPAAEYTNYDKTLEQASKQEPYAFFAEVLNGNLPITSFIDSDFVVVNERLARHYGMEGVRGPEFRRVPIGPETHRGGVLGMAGLLTYLADGTRTLPIRRASWVLRELFNDPPNNPPPNAGEIQPNTSGKHLTVRERLDLHRRDEICASCHAKLDPYGLALENYDAIGQWRERFNGEGFRGGPARAPVLDVSGTFPDGRKFATLEDYKAGLMAQKDKFARAFAVKMLTYALGRPVGYTDHDLIDSLTDVLKKNDYRIQSLIHAIVASEPFNTK